MKPIIFLNNNRGYKWSSKSDIYAKGYAYNSLGEYFSGLSLIAKFSGLTKLADFQGVAAQLNGVFSVVVSLPFATYLISDITRTIPIFYTKQEDKWVISDDANQLYKTYGLDFSDFGKKEFKHVGYVTGRKTLLDNLYQLQAAEIVELAENKVVSYEYWSYLTNKETEKSLPEFQGELLVIYAALARRLIKAAQGKVIVVPLSGGYDSRLVLSLLVKYGYKNISCFTYGVKSSFEVQIAKKVAAKLNVKLEVIEYSNAFVDEYFDKEEFFDYIKFGANFVSLSHIQDFLAVKYLDVNDLIPSDSVFAPGHSGDLFAGTHISKKISINSTLEEVKAEINRAHFSLNSGCIGDVVCYEDSSLPYSRMESWSWKERQSKFIVNSLRVYDYFGYEFALPLWDKELASFFREVPHKLKNRNSEGDYSIVNNLYDSVNFSIFNEMGVAFVKKEKFTIFRKVIAKLRLLLGIYKDEVNNFDYLVVKLEDSMGIKGGGCINSRLANLTYLFIAMKKY